MGCGASSNSSSIPPVVAALSPRTSDEVHEITPIQPSAPSPAVLQERRIEAAEEENHHTAMTTSSDTLHPAASPRNNKASSSRIDEAEPSPLTPRQQQQEQHQPQVPITPKSTRNPASSNDNDKTTNKKSSSSTTTTKPSKSHISDTTADMDDETAELRARIMKETAELDMQPSPSPTSRREKEKSSKKKEKEREREREKERERERESDTSRTEKSSKKRDREKDPSKQRKSQQRDSSREKERNEEKTAAPAASPTHRSNASTSLQMNDRYSDAKYGSTNTSDMTSISITAQPFIPASTVSSGLPPGTFTSWNSTSRAKPAPAPSPPPAIVTPLQLPSWQQGFDAEKFRSAQHDLAAKKEQYQHHSHQQDSSSARFFSTNGASNTNTSRTAGYGSQQNTARVGVGGSGDTFSNEEEALLDNLIGDDEL